MLLFSRISTLSGAPGDVMGAALAVTERVNELVDNEVSMWAGGAGFPLGTTVWSSRMESHAELAENSAKITGDAKYGELVGALNQFRAGDTMDTIRELVHGAPPEGPPPVGGSVWQVTAQVSGGSYADALAWGAEISDMVSGLTGVPTRFFRDLYGPFGQVTWLTGFDDAAGIDAAQAAMAASADYVKMLDRAGTLFIQGSGSQGIATRVA